MAKEFWENDKPAAADDFWKADKPAAQGDLPAGVEPSRAGGGRGRINPPTAPGNIDLNNRPRVRNADGSVSTVRSLGVNVDNQEVLIPTVSEDGRIMSDDEAVRQYRKTGKHLGKFDSPESSTAYAQALHDDQARLIQQPAGQEPPAAGGDASGAGDAAAIMRAAQPERQSVLEGVQIPEPQFDPAEGQRLSNRAYAENTPVPGTPRRAAPVMRASSGPEPTSVATERGAAMQDAPLPVRAAFKAVSGAAQGAGGVIRAAGDFTGSETLQRAGAETVRGAEQFEQGMGDSAPAAGFGPKSPLPYLASMGEGAASSLGQSAALASMFGAKAVIPLMSVMTAGQEYDKARNAGLDPATALAGAVPKGAFEAIGEKFSGLDKVAGAMGTLLTKGASAEARRGAADILVKSGVKEIPGEVITYLGQTGVDMLPGIGLNPDLTMGQFVDGLRDTVVQSAMMGTAMGTGGAVVRTDPRIKRLREAGETGAADLLQQKLDQHNQAATVEGELGGMAPLAEFAATPEFQTDYRALRTEGVKPVEAAGRSALTSRFRTLATGAGMSEKAMNAALEGAKKVGLDKLPGFLQRYTQALAAKGVMQPPQGVDGLGAALEATRDTAMNAAMGVVYQPEPEVRQTMADVQALENAQTAPVDAGKGQSVPQNPGSFSQNTEFDAGNDVQDKPAPGFVRYYHGGEPTGVDGPLWFTSDLRDAKGWVGRSPEMSLWYVDVPEGSTVRGGDPEFGVIPPSRIELPADIANQRKKLAAQATPTGDFDAGNDVLVTPETERVHAAATSPLNDLPEPSQAQKEAGNYRLGRMRIAGMDIAVENPQGSVRRGTDADGNPWESPMRHHYGYFNGTAANDGDKLDVFVQPGTGEDYRGPVYVVDQIDPKTGQLDEHKVLIGPQSEADAEAMYRSNYDAGWQGLGAITRLPMPAFKAWAKSGTLKEPLGDITAKAPATPDPTPAPAAAAPKVQSADGAQPAAPVQADPLADAVNVQNTPPRADTQTQAAPVEAPANDGGDAAGQTAAGAEAGSGAVEAPRVILGRNNVPMSEGGKAFKTRQAADDARKLQPMMRVVRADGGYALTEKSAAQLAAQEKAARRLRNPQTSAAGEPIPAHAMIASAGGLSPDERADMGIDGNVTIGNRKLFAGAGKGLTMERATEKLIEDGYLPEGAGHDQARALIKRSLSQPQYTAEGFERLADAETQARFEAAMAEDEAVAQIEALSDNQFDALDAIPWDDDSNTSTEAAMRALGFTDQEISDALANESRVPPADSAGRDRLDEAAASPAQEDPGSRAQETQRAEEVKPSPQTPADAGVSTSAPAFDTTLRTDGTLAITGDAQAIREALSAIPAKSLMPMKGGILVGRTQADKAQAILRGEKPKLTAREAAEAGQLARDAEKKAKQAAARAKPAVGGLTVGIMPGNAEPVTVKDGVVYIGKNEAVDFDSGEPVRVKAGATDNEIVNALKVAGALSRRQRVFGLVDKAQGASDDNASMESALKAAGLELDDGVTPGKWSMRVRLGDVYVDILPGKTLRARVRAQYLGQDQASVEAEGLPAILANVTRMREGIEEFIQREVEKVLVSRRGKVATDEPAGLIAPTKADVLAQMQRKEDGAKAEAKAKTDAANKDKADAERGEFALTGSDRAADVATAGGQQGMFAKGFDADAFSRMFLPPSAMAVSDVQKAVDQLASKWKSGPDIKVVSTPAELPIEAPSDARGLIHNGTAYIVAGNHLNRDGIAKTLAHEAIGHYGLWRILGADGKKQFVRNVNLAIKSGNVPLGKLSRKVREMYVDGKGKFNLSPAEEANEIAAFAVEAAIDPATGEFKPGFGFVKQVWAKVAEFLRSLGIDIKFTNAELHGMLVSAMRGLEAGHKLDGGGQSLVAAGRSGEAGAEFNALQALSQNDELFSLPKSEKTTVEDIAADNDPAIQVKASKDPAGHEVYTLTMPDGKKATMTVRQFNPDATEDAPTVYGYEMVDGFPTGMVTERPGKNAEAVGPVDDVWIDVSNLKTGGQGAKIYNIAATYAHNTGKVFIGDPAGLSDDALRRRTEQMLSSALKFGTTEHIAPHPRQVEGDKALGIPPLKWTYGDDLGNIKSLIQTSLESYNDVNPLTFEPSTGRYLDSEGHELDADSIRQISRIGRGRETGAGRTTLQRGAVFNALVRESGSQGSGAGRGTGLLERLVGTALQHGASTRGIFYARGSNQPAQSSRDRVPAGSREASERGDRQDSGRGQPPVLARGGTGNLFQPTIWNTPDPTRVDRVIYELQDGKVDLKRVQEAIQKSGQTITEQWDARLAETLYPGRVAYRSATFLDTEAKPLLEAMARNKVPMDELADYLHARGAEERNAQIAKVNPNMPDGGAGTNSKGVLLTDQAARDYLANVSPARKVVLDAMAKRVDAITAGTRNLLVTEGLEKQDTINAWEAAYKNYVPMFRDEAETGLPPHPQGSGFAVKGSASKRATGSTKEVTNILAHVLMQREAAITRAEKNRVALALYGQALSHPNPDFWTTIKPGMSAAQIGAELQAMGVDPMTAEVGMAGVPTIRTVDPVTNKVVDRPNPIYRNMPGAIPLKVNGEDRVLMLNVKGERGQRLAESLKNLDGLTQLDLAGSIIGKATRWLAAVNTQYNPAFGLVNLTRDTLGGAINLGSTELRGNALKVLAQTPVAILGIARELASGGQAGKWQTLYRQFQADGGQTGFKENFRDPNDRAKAVEKELASLGSGKLSPGRAAHAMLDLLDGFNTTLENGVRLSAYKSALDKGISRAEAARLGRELTVDFNRKGRAGREVGPLYAFFNASVQGSARTLEALKGPTGGRIIAGGLSLGILQALMLAAAGYDDDEIPEFVKTRALIIPLFGKDKHYMAIPYPLGLHVLPNTGRVLAELTLNGGKDIGKRTVDAIGEIAGAFNPLGGGNVFTADGALKTVAPTLVDPLIEVGFNKNFAGGQIEKQGYGSETDGRPGVARTKEATMRSTTGQVYMAISKAINTLTGGTDYQAGVLSPTPERVRYLAQTAGGGVLRELEKTVNASTAAARGDKVKMSAIPVAGRFYGEVDEDQVQMSRYFNGAKKLKALESSLNAAKQAGDGEAMTRMIEQHPEIAFLKAQHKVQADIAKLNKAAVSTVGSPETTRDIDKARVETMKGLNAAIEELEKANGKVTLGDRFKKAIKPQLAEATP